MSRDWNSLKNTDIKDIKPLEGFESLIKDIKSLKDFKFEVSEDYETPLKQILSTLIEQTELLIWLKHKREKISDAEPDDVAYPIFDLIKNYAAESLKKIIYETFQENKKNKNVNEDFTSSDLLEKYIGILINDTEIAKIHINQKQAKLKTENIFSMCKQASPKRLSILIKQSEKKMDECQIIKDNFNILSDFIFEVYSYIGKIKQKTEITNREKLEILITNIKNVICTLLNAHFKTLTLIKPYSYFYDRDSQKKFIIVFPNLSKKILEDIDNDHAEFNPDTPPIDIMIMLITQIINILIKVKP